MTFQEPTPEPHTSTDRLAADVQAQAPHASRRILIVDDNADAANTLGRLLALLGYDICVVHDGISAISKCAEFQPALILLDLGMPGIDGLETAERIRRQHQGRDIAFVAVTGWGQDKDRERTLQAGFVAHLTKPVNVELLERTVERVFQVK
jgi:CheY-like chemotaxis protein